MKKNVKCLSKQFVFASILYFTMTLLACGAAKTEEPKPQRSFEEWIKSARINAHDRPEVFQQEALLRLKSMQMSGSKDLYQVYLAMADSYIATGEYSQSRTYLDKALATDKAQKEPELRVKALFHKGLSYSDETNFVKTYKYFALALMSAKQYNLVCDELEIKTEIGRLLTELADYSRAHSVMESAPLNHGCSRFTHQIVMARLLAKQDKFNASFDLYEKFLAEAAGRESLSYLTDIKAEYVPFLIEAGRIKRAEEISKDIMDVMTNKGISHPAGLYEWAIASVLSAKGQHKEALEYAQIVLGDDVELSPSLRLQVDHEVLPLIVQLYEKLGKSDEAQAMRSRLIDNNIKYFSENRSVLLGVAEARLNLAERDGQIAFMSQEILLNKLESERLVLLCMVISLIAIAIIMWGVLLYRRNNRSRNLYKALEARNEVLNERALGAETELALKETLFHESHHRLKNNLHFLVNLFEIQRSRLDSSAVSTISDVLLDAANRVQAMAVIHQFSHWASNGKSASVNDLLTNLVQQTYDLGDSSIAININCQNIELDDEVSKSIVLIVNELLCNAQKHAFDDRTEGSINIVLEEGVEYKNKLTVTDNGKGLDENILKRNKVSMGLKLVKSMVKQINGILDVNTGKFGTQWTIEF